MKKIFKSSLFKITAALIVLVFVAAVSVYFFDRRVNETTYHNFFDAIWWAFVTLTTVGYGDKVPITTGARITSILLMFIGLGMLSVVTASISSLFVSQKLMEGKGLKKLKLKDHLIICGWNQNVSNVLKTLKDTEASELPIILINEEDENVIASLIAHFPELDIHYVRGKATDEIVLKRAAISTARAAVLLANYNNAYADNDTILTTLTLKTVVPALKVSAELLSSDNVVHLKRANADEIIVSGEHSGYLLAKSAVSPGLPRVVESLIMAKQGQKLVKEKIEEKWIGKTFKALMDFYRKQGALLIGTITEEPSFKLNDLVSDDTSMIDNFIKEKFAEVENEYFPETTGELRVNVNPSDEYKILPADSAVIIKNIEQEPA